MKPTAVSQFANWVGGTATGFGSDAVISSFGLDSSQVQPGDLFLAIKGARVDGHDFVPVALKSGAVGALVERPVEGPHIQVENLVMALARLASHFRSSFYGPVVGITGSAGKTTTKELVVSASKSLGPVLKTPGNRNSEYTSPLLWTDLDAEHKLVVVEMAMRGFDQIAHLASFSKPQVGLITNIGFAHLEMVGSRHGIAQAKGELLEALPIGGVAVLWHEDDMLEWLRPLSVAPVLTFGFEPGADCQITDYQAIDLNQAFIKGRCDGKQWEARIPIAGRHIALNAAAAVLTAAYLGVDPARAAHDLADVEMPPMRMEVVEQNGATILLDTYNASPPSMIAAIETMADISVEGRRFAVIGEMKELGNYSDLAHRKVGIALGKSKFQHVIFYGDATRASIEEAVANGLPSEAIKVAESIEDVRLFLEGLEPGDVALVKGSRALQLETAIPRELTGVEGH